MDFDEEPERAYYEQYLAAQVGQRLVMKLRRRLFAHMQRLPLSFHTRSSTGDLLTRLTGDILMLRELLVASLLSLVSEGVLLVGSQGGAPKDPVWVRNLVKQPDIEVRHRGREMKLRARLATPEEKPGLWPVCDQHYPPFADYRRRTDRDIPVFVCEPRPA